MGEDLLHVDPTSADLNRQVSDVQLYDPLDEQAVMRNAILLLTGVACGTADFGRVLARAARCEAAGVVVKARGTPIEDLHAASANHGIPVIVVRDDADWTRGAALARTAVAGAAADSVSGVRLGDMFAFANAVATMTQGATSIVDPTGHVVGYSTIPGQPIDYLRRESTLTLHERTVPALDADYKVVYSLNTAVFVEPHDDEGGQLAIAVRFKKVVDALGGVTINVQMPSSTTRFPGERGRLYRLYIPTGIQHMDGAQALSYARSRHTSTDFDRGAAPAARPAVAARAGRPPGRSSRGCRSCRRAQEGGPDRRPARPDRQAARARLRGRHEEHPLVRLRPAALLAGQVPTPRLHHRPEHRADPGGREGRLHRRSGRRGAAPDAGERGRRGLGPQRHRRLGPRLGPGRLSRLPRGRRIGATPGARGRRPEQHADRRLQRRRDTLPETIAYLEKTFGVEVKLADDPAVRTDIVITIGNRTPKLSAPLGA